MRRRALPPSSIEGGIHAAIKEHVLLRHAIPVLHVSSAAAAEEFYCAKLGFRRHFAYRVDDSLADPCYMGLVRDGVWVHVSSFSGDGVAGNAVYIVVDDVDALHADFAKRGIDVGMEPTDQTWGNREMYIEDADGNSLRFIQESTD